MSIPSESSIQQARLDLQWVNHLLDSKPLDPMLWNRKALLFEKAMLETLPNRQRLERTLLWHSQSLYLDPSGWTGYYNCARILGMLNRHEEALLYLNKAMKLDQGNCIVSKLMISSLIRVGRYQDAARAYEDAKSHGCSLDPDILGTHVNDQPLDPNIWKGLNASGLAKDHNDAIQKILQGEFTFVLEAADPEMFTLQFVVRELIELDLVKEAEQVCLLFEVKNGGTNLTRSLLNQMKAFYDVSLMPDDFSVSPAYPLMEIIDSYESFCYPAIVQTIFSEGGVGKFITPMDLEDFNQQTLWLMEQIKEFQYSLNDPNITTKPIPALVHKVWGMAKLNFLVAGKLDMPMLRMKAAFTLAAFYARMGRSQLPLILNQIVAINAEKAGQWDTFLSACRACAAYFMEQNEPGNSILFLEMALPCENKAAPRERFQLFIAMGDCYFRLGDNEKAGQCFRRAMELSGISASEREQARLMNLGFQRKDEGVIVGVPPVLVDGLTTQFFDCQTPEMSFSYMYTSRHELYDSLLQAVDTYRQIRVSLLERERGYKYLTGYMDLVDTLIRLAVELKLPWNALSHLESHKNIILHNRLRTLMRQKPDDLPDQFWQELQDLVAVYRSLVETTQITAATSNLAVQLNPVDVANHIDARLWEYSQRFPAAASQVRLKLAIGQIPDQIRCTDPEHTLILEFYPGLCFIIRPDVPQSVQVVELPEAEEITCRKFVERFSEIVNEWVLSSSQALEHELLDFLRQMDQAIYKPLAYVLSERDIKNLLIIPSRIMHILPLNLLGSTVGSQECLAERFALSFVPGLSILDALKDDPTSTFANAVFVSNTLPSCPPALCRNPAHDCYALEKSDQESLELSKIFEGQDIHTHHLTGTNAMLPAVCAVISDADIVHFAVHGLFDPTAPESSGVVLPLQVDCAENDTAYLMHNGQISQHMGPFAIGQVLSLNYLWKNVNMFHCRLLNLSSCWTGMVDWSTSSDEFYGLANGFLYAGVKKILNCLWPVHDEASKQFNLLFYSAILRDGLTPANALRQSITQLKEYSVDGKKPFNSPLFWGNFRLIGFDG